uniref:Uncharacterized protein n=1 Tax=Arundo donax TaxID=35708 RepID=A0A0A9B0Z7_ARUDO
MVRILNLVAPRARGEGRRPRSRRVPRRRRRGAQLRA